MGIITETDIFKQFAGVRGGGTGSLRPMVQVPHVPGQLAELASRIAQVDGNISSIVAHGADRGGRTNITPRVEGSGQEKVLDAASSQAELQVLHAWGAEGAGHLCQ